MNIFQLVDLDAENIGLLKTDMEFEFIKNEWADFVDNKNTDIEDFVEFLNTKYPNKHFERFFITDIVTP